MKYFTICWKRNVSAIDCQKRITSLPERMKTFTPTGKFILLALLCIFMAGNVAGQRKMLVKTRSSFNNKKHPPEVFSFF